jgi:uncharacterized protein (TIGR02145 family)
MRYNIHREIGQIGMSSVYLGIDTKFNSPVTIKILRNEFSQNKFIKDRFIMAAKSMLRMNHPSIIKVTDLIYEDNIVAIVMEYIEGETLEEYINCKGKLRNEEIVNFLTQMLDALKYIHDLGLVHGDIKPSNFIITLNGKVKLIGSGISKNMDKNSNEYTLTELGMKMGTFKYMSPEKIMKSKDVSVQSDIYSLGVVLWEMLTGKRIYKEITYTDYEIKNKILNNPLPLTYTKWDYLISKLTFKDLMIRFQNVEEVINALKGLSKQNSKKVDNLKIFKPYKLALNNRIASIFIPFIPILFLSLKFYEEGKFAWSTNTSDVSSFGELISDQTNSVETVQIGNQIWTAKNLDTEYFRNGDLIPFASTDEEWKEAAENKQPAWCYPSNNLANGKKYGKLYNWYAVSDPRGLAPKGYHVPSDEEWKILIDHLGGAKIAYIKMKKGRWLNDNTFGNNKSGFSGLPGGFRGRIGFTLLGHGAYWWSSSEFKYDSSDALYQMLDKYEEKVITGWIDKYYGMSVRCLRD